MNKRLISSLMGLGCLLATAQAVSDVYPPWSEGRNNPVTERGLEFTVPEVDNLPDFHGNPMDAKLSVFVGGNYYFAMAPLVAEFEKEHPEYKGKIYYETIPPGLLVTQIEKGGTITVGNMTWTVKADVYAAGMKRVKQMVDKGYVKAVEPYATNDLAIMVPKGNPGHITSLKDLGKPGVRLVMPNPAFEGIARQIKAALKKAGGEDLVKAVYETKVKNGETILTHIHHRQSPMFLMQGKAVAGVTWGSEAVFQEKHAGNPISFVKIAPEHNSTAIYAAGVLKDAPNPEAAKAWVEFLKSAKALAIFEQYGFKPYRP